MKHKEIIWERNFISICLSCFFVFICFYSLVPTLPLFAKDKFHSDNTQIGLILTVYALAALVSRPFAGVWMKKFGKKQMAIAATALYAAASLAYFAVNSYWLLIALRIVHGFAFGIATTATGTIAADVVPKKRMGEGLGYYGMFMSMAMVIGPFLGLTLIQHVSFPVLFAVLMVFSILGFAGSSLVRRDSLGATKPEGETKAVARFSLRDIFEPAAIPIALCGFLMSFAYGGISAFVSVYGTSLGFMKFTNYFFAVYALMVVLPRPILGRLFDRKGAHGVIYPGIILFVLGLLALSHSYSSFGFLASAAVLGLGYGALAPSFQALAVQAAPSHRKGFATSTYLFFFDAGVATGSMLLGTVAGYSDYRTMYLISALVVALTVVFYFLLHHRRELLRSEKPSPLRGG